MIYFLAGSVQICKQWCQRQNLVFDRDVKYVNSPERLLGITAEGNTAVLGPSWWTKSWADDILRMMSCIPNLQVIHDDGRYGQEYRDNQKKEEEAQERLQSERYNSRFELMELDNEHDS